MMLNMIMFIVKNNKNTTMIVNLPQNWIICRWNIVFEFTFNINVKLILFVDVHYKISKFVWILITNLFLYSFFFIWKFQAHYPAKERLWLQGNYKFSFYQKIYSLPISIFNSFSNRLLTLTSPLMKIITL